MSTSAVLIASAKLRPGEGQAFGAWQRSSERAEIVGEGIPLFEGDFLGEVAMEIGALWFLLPW
jgi:hypothetical protein